MPAMPRSRAIWKACAGRCRSTRPRGIDMLRGQRDEALARRDALRARLHALPPAAAGEALDLASARQALGEAEAAAEHAGNAWAEAGARRTRRQPAPRCCNRRPRPAGPRCCRPRASRSGRSGQGGWPRRAAIMICWRGGWARPRRRWDGQRPALIEQDALRFEQSAALERERSSAGTARCCNCRASWTRPARKAWANGCPRPRPIASGCNVAATSWIGARRHGLAVAAAELIARGRHPAAAGAAGAPAASLPWAVVPRSGAAPGRCLAARRLAARRRRGRAGQPEFRHPRAAGHPGALRLRRPVAGGGASDAAGAGRCTGSRRRGPPRLHEAGACSMPRHATRS